MNSKSLENHTHISKYFLIFILIIKLFYYLFFILNKITKNSTYKYLSILFGNLFRLFISIIIIYLFHAIERKPIIISGTTKEFLFLFGILLAIDINWPILFSDPKNVILDSSQENIDKKNMLEDSTGTLLDKICPDHFTSPGLCSNPLQLVGTIAGIIIVFIFILTGFLKKKKKKK